MVQTEGMNEKMVPPRKASKLALNKRPITNNITYTYILCHRHSYMRTYGHTNNHAHMYANKDTIYIIKEIKTYNILSFPRYSPKIIFPDFERVILLHPRLYLSSIPKMCFSVFFCLDRNKTS